MIHWLLLLLMALIGAAGWSWGRRHVPWVSAHVTSKRRDWVQTGFILAMIPGMFSSAMSPLLGNICLCLTALAAPPLAFGWLMMIGADRMVKRRRQAGLCPWCGYNLTGNESGVRL